MITSTKANTKKTNDNIIRDHIKPLPLYNGFLRAITFQLWIVNCNKIYNIIFSKLQAQELNRVYEQKLEQKSREVNVAREENKKLESLSQNKQLKERGQLDLELQEVKMHLQSRDKEVRVSQNSYKTFKNQNYFNTRIVLWKDAFYVLLHCFFQNLHPIICLFRLSTSRCLIIHLSNQMFHDYVSFFSCSDLTSLPSLKKFTDFSNTFIYSSKVK